MVNVGDAPQSPISYVIQIVGTLTVASKAKVDLQPSTGTLMALAADLQSIANALVGHGAARRDTPSERMRMAKGAVASRATRVAYLTPQLFGEPAWDMLLDLFVAEGRGRAISVSSAAIASGAPSTTAARWIDELCRLDLVQRRPHPIDRRSTYLELSLKGRSAMNAWADDELAREWAVRQ